MVDLIENQMLDKYSDRDIIHVLAYGDAGSQKSTFAATFPKPINVLFFDPFAKAMPYRRGRKKVIEFDEKKGIDVEYIFSKKEQDKAIIQVEHFVDSDLRVGVKGTYARELFEERVSSLYKEVRAGVWGTVVLDSITSCSLAIRKADQYKFNKDCKDSRQWFGAAAAGIEEIGHALSRFTCNVVVLAHCRLTPVSMREYNVYTPEAPGKQDRLLPSVFSEVYAFHWRDGEIVVQTNRDDTYTACTGINAPDMCAPHYDLLWDNYLKEME